MDIFKTLDDLEKTIREYYCELEREAYKKGKQKAFHRAFPPQVLLSRLELLYRLSEYWAKQHHHEKEFYAEVGSTFQDFQVKDKKTGF